MNTQRGRFSNDESMISEAPSELRQDLGRDLCEAEEPRPQAIGERLVAGNSSMRSVGIEPLNYGYVVQIGCQKFAVETPERLIEGLSKYIKNPSLTEEEWMKNHTF